MIRSSRIKGLLPLVPGPGALAWVTPASGARCVVLAASVRALNDLELNDLLVELPVDQFDGLLDAAFPTEGAAA